MQDASIIRNQSKIRATIGNAKAYLAIQDHYGSFDAYIWSFTEGKTIINSINSTTDIPVKTDLSDKMSKDLLKKGFKFVGSTICYSFMQACGMVNDHFNTCSCKNKY
jgi:DNA-3-methyladenine glycosylase I